MTRVQDPYGRRLYRREVHEERVVAGGVPTRSYVPLNAKGLLLLGHGGGHSKDSERFVRLCRQFANETQLAVVLDAAARLEHVDVLLLNMEDDELFPTERVHDLFDAIVARSEQLAFRHGTHDDWSPGLIRESVAFVRQHTA